MWRPAAWILLAAAWPWAEAKTKSSKPTCPHDTRHASYKVLNTAYSKGQKAHVIDWHHKITRARVTVVLKVGQAEPEYAVRQTFRTPARNDNGVALVTAQSVIAGSTDHAHPDATQRSTLGSVATHVGAMVEPNYTSFEFATHDFKDFNSHLETMLEYTSAPMMATDDEIITTQIAMWRKGALDGKMHPEGAVLNEMRSKAYNVSSVTREVAARELYAGTPSAFIDTGRPATAWETTVIDVRDFYKKYYIPANTRIYIIARVEDAKIADWLSLFHKHWKDGNRPNEDPAVVYGAKFPVYSPSIPDMIVPYGAADISAPVRFTLAWAFNTKQGGKVRKASNKERIILSMAMRAMAEHSDGHLWKGLQKRGLASGLSVTPPEFHAGRSYADFSITMPQPVPDDAEITDGMLLSTGQKETLSNVLKQFERTILSTIKNWSSGKLDKARVEAYLDWFDRESRLSEAKRGGSASLCNLTDLIGYDMAEVSRSGWMSQSGLLRGIRADIKKNKNTIADTVKTFLASNTHRIRIAAVPSVKLLESTMDGDEKAWTGLAATARSRMNRNEKRFADGAPKMLDPTIAARVRGMSLDDVSDLPEEIFPTTRMYQVRLPELPTQSSKNATFQGTNSRKMHDNEIPLVLYEGAPPGVHYVTIKWFLPNLRVSEIRIADLILDMWDRASSRRFTTESRNSVHTKLAHDLRLRVRQNHFSRDPSLVSWPHDSTLSADVSFTVLKGSIEEFGNVLRDILHHATLNQPDAAAERLNERILAGTCHWTEGGIDRLADVCSSVTDGAGWLKGKHEGPAAFKDLQALAKDIKEDWPSVFKKLNDVRAKMFRPENMMVAATVSDIADKQVQPKELMKLVRLAALGEDARGAKVEVAFTTTDRSVINFRVRERATMGLSSNYQSTAGQGRPAQSISAGTWAKEMAEDGGVQVNPNSLYAHLTGSDSNYNMLALRYASPGEERHYEFGVFAHMISKVAAWNIFRLNGQSAAAGVKMLPSGYVVVWTEGDPSIGWMVEESVRILDGSHAVADEGRKKDEGKLPEDLLARAKVGFLAQMDAQASAHELNEQQFQNIMDDVTRATMKARRAAIVGLTPDDFVQWKSVMNDSIAAGRRVQLHGVSKPRLSAVTAEQERALIKGRTSSKVSVNVIRIKDGSPVLDVGSGGDSAE